MRRSSSALLRRGRGRSGSCAPMAPASSSGGVAANGDVPLHAVRPPDLIERFHGTGPAASCCATSTTPLRPTPPSEVREAAAEQILHVDARSKDGPLGRTCARADHTASLRGTMRPINGSITLPRHVRTVIGRTVPVGPTVTSLASTAIVGIKQVADEADRRLAHGPIEQTAQLGVAPRGRELVSGSSSSSTGFSFVDHFVRHRSAPNST